HKLAGLVEDFGLHNVGNPNLLGKLWKFNQTMLVLLRAKEINISIRASQDSWKLCGTGIAIRSLLRDKVVIKYARVLAALDLFFLGQLLNRQGNVLIPWSQYMRSKDRLNRGRIPQWFKNIEEAVLANSSTREVKQEFQISEENNLLPVIKRKEVSLDKRKKEWVLMKNGKSKIDIRRVVGKKERELLLEEGSSVNKEGNKIRLVANRANEADKLQMQWIPKEEIFTAIQGVKMQESNWVFDISTDIVESSLEKGVVRKEEIDRISRASLTAVIIVNRIEVELIKKQKFSYYCENLLLEQLNRNISVAGKSLVFYTDGSLHKEISENGMSCRQGLGWIQVGKDEKEMIQKGNLSIQGWPSSTRTELAAIWVALLLSPQDSEVKIYTDSAAAILGINGCEKHRSNKEWLRQKNYNLLLKIFDTKRIKNLKVELVKIKGHSNNYWNDRVDVLAKEGQVAPLLAVQNIELSSRIRYNMYWQNNLVEMPVRKVIKEIEDTLIAADWRMLSVSSWLEKKDYHRTWAWEGLWKRIKKQSGVRCTSMYKGRKLNFLIKCLHDKLPTLSNLRMTRPDLYKDDICKVCVKDAKEMQDHLAVCEAQ